MQVELFNVDKYLIAKQTEGSSRKARNFESGSLYQGHLGLMCFNENLPASAGRKYKLLKDA